jgi:hypothetical protein
MILESIYLLNRQVSVFTYGQGANQQRPTYDIIYPNKQLVINSLSDIDR